MFQTLQEKIKGTNEISEFDFEFAKTLFLPKKLRKKRLILQDGDPCRYTIFVEKDLLRNFTIDGFFTTS